MDFNEAIMLADDDISFGDFKRMLDQMQAGTLAEGVVAEAFLLAGLESHIDDLEGSGKPIHAALIREVMKRYRNLHEKVIELRTQLNAYTLQ